MSVVASARGKARRAVGGMALLLAAATGCSGGAPASVSAPGGSGGGGGGGGGPTTSQAPAAPPAVLTVAPRSGGHNLSPATPVTVRASAGTLSSVRLLNDAGKTVRGTLSTDRTQWRSAEPLGYGKTYTLSAAAANADGRQTTASSMFSTVTPDNFTMPSFGALEGGGTFGVGMPVTLHFDEPITNKAAAEKSLSVTTTPHVAGAWNWIDDQNVHYRPAKYWPAGTKVSVQAKVYGVNMGNGLYGQADKTTSFTVGRSHIAIINNDAHTMYVYFDGKRVKTIPVAMGRGGSIVVKGRTIDFWTRSGPHVVLEKYAVKKMSSASYGLPVTDPLGYEEDIPLATRISGEGEFVHSAPWSVADQGVRNVSHGCVNISPANAEWFYTNMRYGDIVDIKGTPIKLSLTDGLGDWGMPWRDWLAGSALR